MYDIDYFTNLSYVCTQNGPCDAVSLTLLPNVHINRSGRLSAWKRRIRRILMGISTDVCLQHWCADYLCTVLVLNGLDVYHVLHDIASDEIKRFFSLPIPSQVLMRYEPISSRKRYRLVPRRNRCSQRDVELLEYPSLGRSSQSQSRDVRNVAFSVWRMGVACVVLSIAALLFSTFLAKGLAVIGSLSMFFAVVMRVTLDGNGDVPTSPKQL